MAKRNIKITVNIDLTLQELFLYTQNNITRVNTIPNTIPNKIKLLNCNKKAESIPKHILAASINIGRKFISFFICENLLVFLLLIFYFKLQKMSMVMFA